MDLYILDFHNLTIKDTIKTFEYQINQDEETNSKSQINLFRKPVAEKRDYILLKDGKIIIYKGIVDEITNDKNTNTCQIISKEISNIFDRKILEKNVESMKSIGIESFIQQMIYDYFTDTTDLLYNMNYIEVFVESSTKQIEPTNAQDEVYNFHTFITNCRQHKNIFINFIFTDNKKLKIIIENRNLSPKIIDTTLPEVTNYSKIYDVNPVAKVTVKCADTGNILEWYLKSDRTITSNREDVNRIFGETDTIYVDQEEKAYDQALTIFQANRYQHLVQFSINKKSKLVDVSSLSIGTPVIIKTKDDIYSSYISAISIINNNNFVSFKTGQLRVDLVDKLLQKGPETGSNKLDKNGGNVKFLTIDGKTPLVITGSRPYNP